MNRLAKLRKARGLTQMQVAVKAGLSLAGYCQIEQGHRPNARYESLAKIATALNAEIKDFWPIRRESA